MDSPLFSGNKPVLAAVGFLSASHHFSMPGLSLLFASQVSSALKCPLQWCLFMGGSVQQKKN